LKKLTFALFLLTILSAGSWFLLKYAPEKIPFLNKSANTPAQTTASPTPAEYNAWRDSLDRIDLLVRTEQDPRVLRLQKEQQKYFWNKLKSARAAIVIPPPVSTEQTVKVSSDPQAEGLVKFLSRILTIAAIVLALIIVLLLLMLKRKNTRLTRHLSSLQEDERFKGSRAGMLDSEPTRAPIRKAKSARTPSPNSLPDTANLDLSALATQIVAGARRNPQTSTNPTPAPDSRQTLPPLRPTAKQRVTHALKGLADALSTLKSEGPVVSANDNGKPRVKSQNHLRPTQASQVLAPTRYEREREENTEIIKLARRGFTSSEIARRLRVPQDQVETVIRMQRDRE
jgi:hypothetical protein